MPSTGAGGLGGLAGLCDGVAGGRVAKRGLSHTSHKMLLAAFTIVQLLQCHSKKIHTNTHKGKHNEWTKVHDKKLDILIIVMLPL